MFIIKINDPVIDKCYYSLMNRLGNIDFIWLNLYRYELSRLTYFQNAVKTLPIVIYLLMSAS